MDSHFRSVIAVVFLYLTLALLPGKATITALQNPCLVGIRFTDNLLWELPTISRVLCASLCWETTGCLTFTFAPVSETPGQGRCRGHAGRMTTSRHAHDVRAGTEVYAFDGEGEVASWMDSACTGDQDCTELNSRCFRGLCTCTQGYYYSVSTKACLDCCSTADLQSSYTMYTDSVVVGYNYFSLTNQTLTECLQTCDSEPLCLHVDYHSDGDRDCRIGIVSAKDVPTAWSQYFTSWAHYQKNCA